VNARRWTLGGLATLIVAISGACMGACEMFNENYVCVPINESYYGNDFDALPERLLE